MYGEGEQDPRADSRRAHGERNNELIRGPKLGVGGGKKRPILSLFGQMLAAPPCRGKVEKKGGVFRGPEREKNGSPWDFFRPQGVGAGKEEAIDAPPLKSR